MKILPNSHLTVRVEDVVAGFNMAPKPGDQGHVDDHAKLSQVMFDIPQTTAGVGAAYRSEGQWHLAKSTNLESETQTVSFAEVREYVERVGVVAVSGEPHLAADGETDWTVDDEALEGVSLYILASGVIGLTHAVANLIQRVNALDNA